MTSLEPQRRLFAAAQQLWADYLQAGPGKVNPQHWELFQAAAEQLLQAWSDRPADSARQDALATLTRLARQCSTRTEGLCFVTGEAGLIPRRDLHDAFEAALESLRPPHLGTHRDNQ